MGLQIGEIVQRRELQFSELKDKVVAVDAFNTLYQFLSTVRQPDGTPLQDKKGRITSHLSGIFYRNISLILEGMKLVYVFDGKPPELKKKTNQIRQENRDKARELYEEAKKREDTEGMRRYAQQLTRLTPEMIEESKKLLQAMGVAVVQAPGEGEAQASYLAKHEAFAVGSQDYDALLFGTPRLIQNLTLARRRKTISGYKSVYPEMIELEKVLNFLQINHDQLICLGILSGTDYNPKGVFRIGPKKALKIVKQYKQPTLIFDSVKEEIEKMPEEYWFDWQEIFQMFKQPDVHKNINLTFPEVNEFKVKEILMEHDFSEERVDNQLVKLQELKEAKKQKNLDKWF